MCHSLSNSSINFNCQVVPFALAMTCVPESPHWLLEKGNEWAGEQALKWLRGRGPEALDREIEMIKKELRIRKRERQSITMLLEPEILKPFIISLLMMFFLQMSGFNVMVFYCGFIFREVGSTIDPDTASIVVGSVLLLSCFVALLVVSQMNRKLMLILSILGMAAAHLVLGTCFYLSPNERSDRLGDNSTEDIFTQTVSTALDIDGGDEGDLVPSKGVLGWLPLLALSLFLFLGNVGYGTLIWVVTAELLPPKARFTSCHAFLCPVMMLETILDA